MSAPDPTTRFSNRVENYLRYRPRYPRAVIDLLRDECGLRADSIIADLGSGTGMLAELFLANGNRVYAVEPNREMREAGERLFGKQPGFTSIAASAESTTLPDSIADFITAGQAFHWFDQDRSRIEFKRILRPGGWVVLVWNDRKTDTTSFLVEYEQLLKDHATDYEQVNHKRVDAAMLGRFFGSSPALRTFPNDQHFGLESLKGRLLSSSYVPAAGQPGYEPMLAALDKLFKKHQRNDRVTIEHETLVYYCQLK